MLEAILLTIVLVYVFGYLLLKAIYWLFDRPMSAEKRQQLIQAQLSKPEPSQTPAQSGSSLPY